MTISISIKTGDNGATVTKIYQRSNTYAYKEIFKVDPGNEFITTMWGETSIKIKEDKSE